MLGSLPQFSAFKLGRLAGGGMRRTDATLPNDCMPCLAITVLEVVSIDLPCKRNVHQYSAQKVYGVQTLHILMIIKQIVLKIRVNRIKTIDLLKIILFL